MEISTQNSLDRLLSSYDYKLPTELIAQTPAIPRDSARLLVVDSPTTHHHAVFSDLPDLLLPGDLLVLNNTRVIPARIYGRKSTGAPVEALLIEERQPNCWLALMKPGRRLPPGTRVEFAPLEGEKEERGEGGRGEGREFFTQHSTLNTQHFQLSATVLERDKATGGRLLQFDLPEGVSLRQLLDRFGEMPLPPYIKSSSSQPQDYQTVYADRLGAVAAPTAGLHFTSELLQQLQQRGIGTAFITLHVGIGTFRPIEVEDITTHKMHGEWVEVSPATVEQIQKTRANGGRIIAVGTTVARSLEAAAASGKLQSYRGNTELFIYPGYRWQVVDGLITNFHLPRSSLLMLVSALIGRERLLELYEKAIGDRYRFYSFGDAMLIVPQFRIA
ncbi:MAG: tRNA preQ1(34) S-adenosylmethionine ribosyltransferase-isomerase QueA [Cyanosarcina radialis HA8281-LM2]|jgi:S-adenosylmethionine:tRNA ribosyltransferase-isomerase|nr:tRNA preQ1(34) S-adenosylmethionine ribosyltransferase-isomerase QueA [Cyanosarcina radialis HA8281-LM2]